MLYCGHRTGPLLSANVLLIVLPITANNASDKISCGWASLLKQGDFAGTLLVVSILLCTECVRVNTPEHIRGRRTHLGSPCSPRSVCVFARGWEQTRNNRPSFVPAVLAALITALSTSLLDSWVGL